MIRFASQAPCLGRLLSSNVVRRGRFDEILPRILLALVSSLTAAADTHIDAPMPPYCSPRGNWAECAPDPATTSVIQYPTDGVADLAEFHPFVRKRMDRAFFVAGGYAKLTLRWTEDEAEPNASLAVVSRCALGSRIADQLARRFQEVLDQERVLAVGIERFAWPWQRDPESDWCEVSRETVDEVWIVECGAE
ncbi:MAG: hypothetical protein U0900_23095 [Myxococcota bacterium]